MARQHLKRPRVSYLLVLAGCLLGLAPLAYLPLGFIGFVADPRWSFGTDSGAYRDHEIGSAWIALIGSLLAPGLVCVLAGVALATRGADRPRKLLAASLIGAAATLACWKLSVDVHALQIWMNTPWRTAW